MPEKLIEPLAHVNLIIAAMAAGGLWIWRALAVGMRLGELTNEVKNLRSEVKYIRDKLDGHIERQNGGGV